MVLGLIVIIIQPTVCGVVAYCNNDGNKNYKY